MHSHRSSHNFLFQFFDLAFRTHRSYPVRPNIGSFCDINAGLFVRLVEMLPSGCPEKWLRCWPKRKLTATTLEANANRSILRCDAGECYDALSHRIAEQSGSPLGGQ